MAAKDIKTVAPLRVLLVDDVRSFRTAACACLQDMVGVRVVGEASGGEEAFEQVVRLRPDLVLMDVHMTQGNGLETAKRIRAFARNPQIVLFSLQSDETLRRAALAAGADDFFSKSDFVQSVSATVDRMIRNIHSTERGAMGTNREAQQETAGLQGLEWDWDSSAKLSDGDVDRDRDEAHEPESFGVIHNLNNLLQEIMANAALARRRVGGDHPARTYLADIELAGTRAGALIRKLVDDELYGNRGRDRAADDRDTND